MKKIRLIVVLSVLMIAGALQELSAQTLTVNNLTSCDYYARVIWQVPGICVSLIWHHLL